MESKKELYEKVMHYAHLLEDRLGYDETKEGERWGQLVNQLQNFDFDTKVCFLIATYPADELDEQPHKEVLAVLVDTKKGQNVDCYTHLGQHSTCSKDFINQQCKKASPEQYKELQKEMENLGYILEIVN